MISWYHKRAYSLKLCGCFYLSQGKNFNPLKTQGGKGDFRSLRVGFLGESNFGKALSPNKKKVSKNTADQYHYSTLRLWYHDIIKNHKWERILTSWRQSVAYSFKLCGCFYLSQGKNSFSKTLPPNNPNLQTLITGHLEL